MRLSCLQSNHREVYQQLHPREHSELTGLMDDCPYGPATVNSLFLTCFHKQMMIMIIIVLVVKSLVYYRNSFKAWACVSRLD
jgi:hypothetical protein